jgi:hypothetical protein
LIARHRTAIHAVAFWSDPIPDWPTLRAVCRGEADAWAAPRPLPPSLLLSAAERRRAPESVQLALHVAHQAVQASGFDAARMSSVFASPHGDLGITHAMCESLASDPTALSPTRFVHSVHNAVAGHWGMAMRCTSPGTAIANGRCTFAAAWVEAATQAACEGAPVLLVAFETAPRGATGRLTGTVGRLAVALVLGPVDDAPSLPDRGAQAFGGKGESAPSVATWRLCHEHADSSPSPRVTTTSTLVRALEPLVANHLADALVWLQALARADASGEPVLALPLSGAHGGVRIEWTRFDE